MNTNLRIHALLCLATLPFGDESYFPVKTKTGEEGLTSFEAKWYSESLERMKEPRLPRIARDPSVVVYRFLILPTWGNSIAVRVQKEKGIYTLSARRLDGQAGYNPGKLVEQRDIRLSETDSNSLEMLVKNLKFFEMSTDEKVRGHDGDEWILEGVANGKYHVIRRWCASSYDPKKRELTEFIALCKFLINKSTLSDRPKNKGHLIL
jgi:hypothetical protein